MPKSFSGFAFFGTGALYRTLHFIGDLYTHTSFPLLSGIVTTIPSLVSVVSNSMNYVTWKIQ